MRVGWRLVSVGAVVAVGSLFFFGAELRTGAVAAIRRVFGSPPSEHPHKRAWTPSGVAVWVLGDSTKVLPGDSLGEPWSVGSLVRPIELEGARGETVAFQLVLASREGLPKISVEVGHLLGQGARIPREQIAVFLESYIDCPAVPREVVSLGPGEYPDPLIPLPSTVSLAPGRNQPLWIDVEIPRQARPGRYAGGIRVLGGPSGAIDVPLSLTVYPFELPASPSLTAWVPLYAGLLADGEQASETDRDLLWAYYRMAHAHRFVTQVAEEEPQLRWEPETGRLLQADWKEYDARNGPALDGSLFDDGEAPALWKVGGFMGWGKAFGGNLERDTDITAARRRALTEYAREIESHFKERGWSAPQLFMYLIDEPDFRGHPNLAHIVSAYGRAIHESGTGIRHFVTVGPQESPIPEGSVDIWATWGAGFQPKAMRSRQALGERVWFYQQHEPFVGGHCLNHEGLGLRSWGWIAWRYQADGVFLWVGNFWNKDPYRDPKTWDERQMGNGVLFYPGRLLGSIGLSPLPGPVSSFRMKSLRRGLFDHEYFRVLRDRGGDPDALVSRIVRQALGEGDHVPHWRHPRWAQHGDWSHDPQEWDDVRREVARQIVARMPS